MKFSIKFLLFIAASALPAAVPLRAQSLQQQMLSHVEKVFVIDSIAVDKYEFFRRYRLQPSAGRIITGDEVAATLRGTEVPPEFEGGPFTGFTNEFNDYLIWAQQDTTGYLRLAESVRLVDGSWSTPRLTPPVLNTGEEDDDEPVEANAAFPFMSDDGQTLYFASDNAFSLGGYDIFIATKDPSDGEFLIPGNLGMPFNSPYDDYMLVLDRQTGVGWWASDRNQLEDKITVYVYVLSDDRVNVDPDDENLQAYSTLYGWESLLDGEQQSRRQHFLEEIASISVPEAVQDEFVLPMPGGAAYRNFSDFRSPKAASQFQLYLGRRDALDRKTAQLASLRADFARGNRSQSAAILSLEEQVRSEESSLRALLSDIYKLESNLK